MIIGDIDTESVATVEDAQSNKSIDGGEMGRLCSEVIILILLRNLLNRFQISRPHKEGFKRGLLSLDQVDLETIFRRRPIIMRSVPIRTRLLQDWQFWTNQDRSGLGNSSCCHAWSSQGGVVKKSKFREHFAHFALGQSFGGQ